MTINNKKSEDITFIPYKWDFDVEGIWGIIYFLVKKDIFERGNRDWVDCEYFTDNADLVYISTSYMENSHLLETYKLEEVLLMAKNDIIQNLPLKQKGTIANALEIQTRM